MIRFLLNDKTVSTSLSPGLQLLDLIRYHEDLKGTKIGCREGDCGACTVLVGSLIDGKLKYRSMTSCLLPLSNVNGKHVVTIEGLNFYENKKEGIRLNVVQQAMASEGATQCGFCTPGFVVSLAGYCLNGNQTYQGAETAIDGNICRCTGYKSIQRAAATIQALLADNKTEDPISFAISRNIVPHYFKNVKSALASFQNGMEMKPATGITVAGGTDLYVQIPEKLSLTSINSVFDTAHSGTISRRNDRIYISGANTVTDLIESSTFNEAIPAFHRYAKLVSSTPIRNMATVAGNFVNASPIGDLTILFLALEADISLKDPETQKLRRILLKDLYKGYRQLNKKPEELIEQISFPVPAAADHFNFEKVSKRTHLDIASVNTAMCLRMNGNVIRSGSIAAGGVAPIPLYLKKCSAMLEGEALSETLIRPVIQSAMEEITPISDARGSSEYKKLLLSQLIRAHFNSFLDKSRSTGD